MSDHSKMTATQVREEQDRIELAERARLRELSGMPGSTKFVLRGKPKQTGEWRDINSFRNEGNAMIEYQQFARHIGAEDYGWESIALVVRETIVKDTVIQSV